MGESASGAALARWNRRAGRVGRRQRGARLPQRQGEATTEECQGEDAQGSFASCEDHESGHSECRWPYAVGRLAAWTAPSVVRIRGSGGTLASTAFPVMAVSRPADKVMPRRRRRPSGPPVERGGTHLAVSRQALAGAVIFPGTVRISARRLEWLDIYREVGWTSGWD
jgi:hypothetical protein